MRTTLIALALALPILGSDRPLLERAVELFRSDSPKDRDDGSRMAKSFVETSLRPLVDALDDDDPEVRRRAREAVISVLADRSDLPEEVQPQSEFWGLGGGGGGPIIINQRGVGGRVRIQVFNNGNLLLDESDQAGQALNQVIGIQGVPATDAALRTHLRLAEGRGFLVTTVDPNARGAKLGLSAYDIVTTLNGRPVMEAQDLVAILGEDPDWECLVFGVIREGESIRLSGQTTPAE
ncbi:MAG: hypothetical protein ACT4PV_03700 [Planctomycetaceae bacterium]